MKIYFIILFQILTFYAIGQTFSYRTLTTDDGLPSNTVYQIKQDKKGFIWMATANGLVRYDGRNFKSFNPEGIKDKDIIGLYIDSKDIVWFWNLTGKLFYIKDEKKFNKNLNDQKVRHFLQDNNNLYWFTTNQGLYQLKGNNELKKIDFLRVDNIISDDFILTNYLDKISIFKDEKKINQFSIHIDDKNQLYKNEVNNYIISLLNNQVFVIQNPEGYISIFNDKGIIKKRPFQQYEPFLEGKLSNIYQDKNGNYWVVTNLNTYIFNEKFSPYKNLNPVVENQFINNYLNDSEGNHWLAIKDKGIQIIPSIEYAKEKIDKKDLKITSLYKKDNVLCIGTDKGKLILKNLLLDKEDIIFFERDFTINGIYSSSEKDMVWIHSNTESIHLNVKSKKYIRYIAHNQMSLKTIWNDADNAPLLIGYFHGALYIPNNKIPYFIYLTQNSLKIKNPGLVKLFGINGVKDRVYAIEKVGQEYWLGSTNGLYESIRRDAKITSILELQNVWITQIVNQNDTVWVGTQTDGLFQIFNKKIIKHYNERNGLVSNSCKKIIVEPNGIVWVGTNNGINKINTNTGEINLINKLDGLVNNDITALTVDNQKIYVGTSQGLTSFDKNIQTKNTVPPPIYFSSFQIFEKDTTLSESYVLKHNENNIHIGFTGVSFRSQGTIKYKYRMKGLSNDWKETTSDYASYPVLNPDEYTFEAVAINEDGIESEVPIQIKITILQPFWQTWWFQLSLLIAFLLIFWAIMRSRVNRIRERLQLKNEYQQKINELEMQALQAQMNPHFIFNVLNSIQHYLTLNDGERAMIYLAKFAKLIRMIFDFSRKPTISLYEEINFLNLYMEMEKLRFKQRIEIELTVDDNIDEEYIKIPPLMIQPLVENCFKHGLLHKENGGKVSVRFEENSRGIICIVEDNGIGRAAAKAQKSWKTKKHKSAGVNTTKERLELWLAKKNHETPKNAFKIIDLEDENGQASGTRIELLLQENKYST